MLRFTYLRTPLHKYTFSVAPIRNWVEKHSFGKVLNLFAGPTKLGLDETRVDADVSMNADVYTDAYDFVTTCKQKFDTVILDPPYSYRKSMEMYHGKKASRLNAVKDTLYGLLNPGGIVITFGYHSVSMGKKRGFKQTHVLLMSHGGAIHDTVAVIEQKI